MTLVRREIDNDVRSPTYLCEVEEIVTVRPVRVPVWTLVLLLVVLIAFGRLEDVAAAAHWLD